MFVLIAHRKAPFIVGVAAGTVKHPQATFDYSFLVVKVDYICHVFHRSNIGLLQLICYQSFWKQHEKSNIRWNRCGGTSHKISIFDLMILPLGRVWIRYKSQEMPNLRRFLARLLPGDNNFGNYFLNNNRIIIKKFNNSHRIILEFSRVIYGILFSKIPKVVFRKILKDS